MKKITMAILLLIAGGVAVSAQDASPLYKDPSATVEARVADLLSRMTLEEKAAQMKHIHFKHFDSDGKVDLEKLAASVGNLSRGCIEAFPYTSAQYMRAMYSIQKYMVEETRLGIPVIPVMEGLHGVVQDGCTVFPQAIAQGATFNPDLIGSMAESIADEMSAIGAVQALAPDLDIARELRWGRVEETFGEDPYLVSRMGIAYMKSMREKGRITTPKHFLAHGWPVAGLNLASVKGGERELRDLYLVPFRNVIENQAPLSIMNCYSSYDGEAVTGSEKYMTDLLRGELGFRGYVYSDWGSVNMLTSFHKVAADTKESARQAVVAGIDLEAGSEDYENVVDLVRSGRLDVSYVDRAVSNILYAKFASGLFDHPLPYTTGWEGKIHTGKARLTARAIADESTVLLSNKNGILPLNPDRFRSIAVIGPNADRIQFGDYSWSSDKKNGVTPLAGISAYLEDKDVKIHYAEGCDPYSQDRSGFRDAVRAAGKSDLALVFAGSQSAILARAGEPATCGEGYDLTDLKLPGVQMELIREVARAGKPVIVILVTGKPFETEEIASLSEALLVQWYAGEEAGNSIASILFGEVNPSGKLPVSFPKSVGHLPCYYNYFPTDKGYYNNKGSLDKPGHDYVFSDPYSAWPFGFGLSYTEFSYSGLSLDKEIYGLKDTVNVEFTVRNDGGVTGKTVPQLYVRDLVSSVVTPVKQLRAFDKISLDPGESRIVRFSVPVSALSLHDRNMREVVEPGEFSFMVGSSSADIMLEKIILVNDGNAHPEDDSPSMVENMPLGENVCIRGTVRNVQAAVLQGVRVYPMSMPDKAVTTDREGKYSMELPLNDVLVFELGGYTSLRRQAKREGDMDVELYPATD